MRNALSLLSESTSVRLGLVVSLLGATIWGTTKFVSLQEDHNQLKVQVASLQQSREAYESYRLQNEIRVQAIESNYAHIMQSMGKIEAKLEQIEASAGSKNK